MAGASLRGFSIERQTLYANPYFPQLAHHFLAFVIIHESQIFMTHIVVQGFKSDLFYTANICDTVIDQSKNRNAVVSRLKMHTNTTATGLLN